MVVIGLRLGKGSIVTGRAGIVNRLWGTSEFEWDVRLNMKCENTTRTYFLYTNICWSLSDSYDSTMRNFIQKMAVLNWLLKQWGSKFDLIRNRSERDKRQYNQCGPLHPHHHPVSLCRLGEVSRRRTMTPVRVDIFEKLK